jgi:hypothetical protein
MEDLQIPPFASAALPFTLCAGPSMQVAQAACRLFSLLLGCWIGRNVGGGAPAIRVLDLKGLPANSTSITMQTTLRLLVHA